MRWLETFIASCLYYSGLVSLFRWWKQRSEQTLIILNYHRATGGNLRKHLLYLRHHYRILPLEEALEELYAPQKSSSLYRDRRMPLVLTFDDGYYDNYTHAFQLASELHIPITIFLIPGYIESGSLFGWLAGDHLVSNSQVSEIEIEDRLYHLDRVKERKALAQTINERACNAASISERAQFLASAETALAVHSLSTAAIEEKDILPINWKEAQEMKKSGWVSFGAHTMYHPTLACLTNPADVQYEVSECRVVLERRLECPIRTFCYPYGLPEHIGKNAIRAVEETGYTWAVTTIYGYNTAQTNPYLLRRIGVDVSMSWMLLAARTSGAWSFFSQRFHIIVEWVLSPQHIG